jgi:uroporphyrinogen-III synthase
MIEGERTMTQSLTGQTIALAESRQLEELAQMLEQEGAGLIRCPMVSILDAPIAQPVLDWIQELIDDRFYMVIFYTGEGVRRLLGFAERAGLRAQFIHALGRARTLTRGPKPVRALKELGLAPTLVSAVPTTDGLIATLQNESLSVATVGVQLFSDTPLPLLPYLERAAAEVRTVLPYVYAPASDAHRVAALIDDMANGNVNLIAFTSSPQVTRLYDVAKERSMEKRLDEAWTKVKVAAVGPVVADDLRAKGIPVDICPEQGFVMKNLVQHIKRAIGV